MAAQEITEREWVKRCMTELCSKAGFADCSNLVQRELEFICDSIESKTGVLISLSTIKRLLKGQFSRQPQVATLDAISVFLGYLHWQDFKLQKLHERNVTTPNESPVQEEIDLTVTLSKEFSYTRYLVIGSLLIVAALGLFAFLNFNKHKPTTHSAPTGIEKAQFSMTKTTRNDMPNTVVFNYDLDDVTADSFFIQQSWDKDRRVRIDKKNHTLTDIYYEPGYHIAKLIANDQVIKTVDVSIPTDRWFFYAKERKAASIPEYISSGGFKNGSLTMSQDEATNSGVDIQKEHVYIQVWFPTKIEYSSDNYIMKCRVRVNELKTGFCPFMMYEVFCQKHFMYFKSMSKGCTSEMKAQFGENVLDGKTTDLSALATNAKEWQDVEIMVKNKLVTIKINQTTVLSTAYNESSGKITGLGFIATGLPEVDFVSLQTLDGRDIYSNDFGK